MSGLKVVPPPFGLGGASGALDTPTPVVPLPLLSCVEQHGSYNDGAIVSLNEEGFVRIPRLLVLSLLLSVCVAPVAAQSSLDRNPQPSVRLDQIIPPAEFRRPVLPLEPQPPFHSDGIGLSGQRYVQRRAGDQSNVTCYSIRSYRVTRDDPESDSTSPAGYSTCQPVSQFQLKDAGDSPVQASFR
jgi:hypothetical protein